MANHINDFFEACTPKEEQKNKMLKKILNEIIGQNDRFIFNSKKNILPQTKNDNNGESKIKCKY